MDETFFQKFIKSPFSLVLSLFFFILASYWVWGVSGRLFTLYQERKALEAKIAELDRKNREIKKEIRYAESEGFLEREGKERMNLKKQGEEVVVIVPEEETGEDNDQARQGLFSKLFGAVISFFR